MCVCGGMACLHEVVIVGHLPALPAQLQPVGHLKLALAVHDGNAPCDAVNAVCHIPHHLHHQQAHIHTLCSPTKGVSIGLSINKDRQ